MGVKVEILAESMDGHDDPGLAFGQVERGAQVFEQALVRAFNLQGSNTAISGNRLYLDGNTRAAVTIDLGSGTNGPPQAPTYSL